MLRRAEISRIRSWPVLASGHSEKHAETRKKQAKIALRLRGPAAPLLRKVAFLMQNVAKSPWYVPGVLHHNRGFLGVFLRKVHMLGAVGGSKHGWLIVPAVRDSRGESLGLTRDFSVFSLFSVLLMQACLLGVAARGAMRGLLELWCVCVP